MTAMWTGRCPAIECEGCAHAIKNALAKVAGVQRVTVEVDAKHMSVQYDPSQTSEAAVRDRLAQIGFPPQ